MLKVHRISLKPSLPIMQPVNVFLVEGEKPILVDSGYEESVDQLLAEIEKLGFKLEDISMIINTHEHIDHFGGNALIKERSHAKIAAHEIAMPLIEDMRSQFPSEDELRNMPDIIIEYAKARGAIYEKMRTAKIDIELKDGDVINLGEYSLEVLHTPGHTRGHICLYEKRNRMLFVGDLITERGTPFIGCLHGNFRDFIGSLQRIRSLETDQVFLSHDGEIRNVHERIDEILEQKSGEREKLLEALEEGEKSLSQLVDIVYPKGGFQYFTYSSVLAHLIGLRNEGKVKMWKEKAGRFIVSLS